MSKNAHSLAARNLSLLIGLSFVLAATLTTPHTGRAAGVLYVAPTAAGSGDCSSWSNACLLQTALGNAISSDEIWVMQGVHKPTTDPSDRVATFTLKNGVTLYGGFDGTEISLSQRDWQANLTVLSGDIDNNDSTDPNGVVTTTAKHPGQ